MTLKELANLHKIVVHEGMEHSPKCRDYDARHPNDTKPRYFTKFCLVCKEHVLMRDYPYDLLEHVCSECFSNPDSFIVVADVNAVDIDE